jgi:pyruvyltransferase
MNIKEIIYAVFIKYPTWFIGILKGNAIKTHWGRSKNNFGDCLSPYILRHYGFTPVYCQQKDSDIVLAGSILQWVPKNYDGIILGTGGQDIKYCFTNAKVLAVRGIKTKNNFCDNEAIELGDPGLIMKYVFPSKIKKKYKIGIIPHFVDHNHNIIKKWVNIHGNSILLIDVLRDAKTVIEDIKSCEFIISSSLHGLIIADAFYIPNIRFVIKGSKAVRHYKFDDYYSSIGQKNDYFIADETEDIFELINSVIFSLEKKEEVIKRQILLNKLFENLKTLMLK